VIFVTWPYKKGSREYKNCTTISPQHTEVARVMIDTLLFESVSKDHVLWTNGKHGLFTVKFRQRLAMREFFNTNLHHVAENWKQLWEDSASHKAPNLLWRICCKCVPTRASQVATPICSLFWYLPFMWECEW